MHVWYVDNEMEKNSRNCPPCGLYGSANAFLSGIYQFFSALCTKGYHALPVEVNTIEINLFIKQASSQTITACIKSTLWTFVTLGLFLLCSILCCLCVCVAHG
eukprot:scpid114789/ scgid18347/ 